MNQSYLLLTDPGGTQEEAPGKPVLVMRDTTGTPANQAGTLKLVVIEEETIYKNFQDFLPIKRNAI